jgi:hypothetical protein
MACALSNGHHSSGVYVDITLRRRLYRDLHRQTRAVTVPLEQAELDLPLFA